MQNSVWFNHQVCLTPAKQDRLEENIKLKLIFNVEEEPQLYAILSNQLALYVIVGVRLVDKTNIMK
jgi:hypothetical protein